MSLAEVGGLEAEGPFGMQHIGLSFAGFCAAILACGYWVPAYAADEILLEAPGGEITFLGGVGYAWLQSDEIVYDNAGNRVSQLFWESETPIITLGADAMISANWTVSAKIDVGLSGNGEMKDYDWLEQSPSFAFNDWSSRSIHPETKQDRYVDLDIAVGRNFDMSDTTVVNLQGGFKYTDVKWTARGGSIVNSTQNGFRDNSRTFPDGLHVITFEHQLPALFAGAGATTKAGRWAFSALLRGGVTIGASDTDHHWLRNLRFEEEYSTIPFVSVDANVVYSLNERSSLYLGGSFDKYFRTKGDSTLYDQATGAQATFNNAAGLDFRSVSLSSGLKIAF